MNAQSQRPFYKRKKRKEIYHQEKDPYRTPKKVNEPSYCSECGAVFTRGRWSWEQKKLAGAEQRICPACRRIRDHYPAGIIRLRGSFLKNHQNEILNLLNNIEQMEKAYHPLERIMNISEEEDGISVTTTGIHIARQIGEAISSAYGGELSYSYDAENFIRVNWNR